MQARLAGHQHEDHRWPRPLRHLSVPPDNVAQAHTSRRAERLSALPPSRLSRPHEAMIHHKRQHPPEPAPWCRPIQRGRRRTLEVLATEPQSATTRHFGDRLRPILNAHRFLLPFVHIPCFARCDAAPEICVDRGLEHSHVHSDTVSAESVSPTCPGRVDPLARIYSLSSTNVWSLCATAALSPTSLVRARNKGLLGIERANPSTYVRAVPSLAGSFEPRTRSFTFPSNVSSSRRSAGPGGTAQHVSGTLAM
jgi:hypothetical protein